MKVRATQDGVYGGYLRVGPIQSDQGYFPGEVFEIDERPFPITDMDGKPVFERTESGSIKMDNVTKKPIIKMGSWFSPEWMEKMPDETPTTWEYPPFQIPVQYRAITPRTPSAPVLGQKPMIPAMDKSVI